MWVLAAEALAAIAQAGARPHSSWRRRWSSISHRRTTHEIRARQHSTSAEIALELRRRTRTELQRICLASGIELDK
jgi:hypothetical protein